MALLSLRPPPTWSSPHPSLSYHPIFLSTLRLLLEKLLQGGCPSEGPSPGEWLGPPRHEVTVTIGVVVSWALHGPVAGPMLRDSVLERVSEPLYTAMT